jgi:hypothetical protein
MIRRVFLSLLLSVVATAFIAYAVAIRPAQRKWGVDPDERISPLPGDDLVTEPNATDTRGITIEATPDKIWPWLVQMGFGRAGWYSYDRLDNEASSTWSILPEHQQLEVGGILPTHPGGGFRIEQIEAERALVLYLDSEIVAGQAGASENAEQKTSAGLKASGVMGGLAMPEFRASWTFALKPIDEQHTRLIERFRVLSPQAGPVQRVVLPIFGLGVFIMSRKQLLGIRERAEEGPRPASEPLAAAA